MKASSVIHKNEKRIKVEFPNTKESTKKIKEIAGAKWSTTMKSWHIPYTREAFEQLKFCWPEIQIVNSTASQTIKESQEIPLVIGMTIPESIPSAKSVSVIVSGRKIILKLPKNEMDVRFIMSLKYSRWDKNNFFWIVPHYPGNLELVKKYFGERISKLEISEAIEIENKSGKTRRIDKNEMLVVETGNGRLHIYFAYDKAVAKKIKDFPYHKWNKGEKCWSIPYSESYLKEIKLFAENNGLKFTFERFQGTGIVKRVSSKGEIGYRTCPEEYFLKLRELRYSENTIKTYSCAFEEFVNYYKEHETRSIAENMITDFLRYLVIERKVSGSYQNQAINAIKFYFEIVLRQDRKIYRIDRPKKETILPEVLNEEEVKRLFGVTENLKHKSILMMAYSSGLRLSELINLKIKDIDSERMQIRVEQSKGRKDRYTILSKKMLSILREYFKAYKPKEWLFEGEKGDRYSGRSIQQIMKAGCRKAGIKKKVAVHSLRHTFATHLLENGTDLRYIQNLLGHESSKTTEIYTHITTKGFDQIKNPLDQLDL